MRMGVVFVVPAALFLGGCQALPLQAAQDCFETNGLLIFNSFGDMTCMDQTEYALPCEPLSNVMCASTLITTSIHLSLYCAHHDPQNSLASPPFPR